MYIFYKTIKKFLILTNDKSNSIIFKFSIKYYKYYKNYILSIIRRKFMIIRSYQLYHKLYTFTLNKFSSKKETNREKLKNTWI